MLYFVIDITIMKKGMMIRFLVKCQSKEELHIFFLRGYENDKICRWWLQHNHVAKWPAKWLVWPGNFIWWPQPPQIRLPWVQICFRIHFKFQLNFWISFSGEYSYLVWIVYVYYGISLRVYLVQQGFGFGLPL